MAQATKIVERLREFSSRVKIAGSLRRQRELVGDIEVLIIAKHSTSIPAGELFERKQNLTEAGLESLLAEGFLKKRHKKDGTETYGPKVKLLLAGETKIPVDIFTCTEDEWFNLLVVRTGGKETNIEIASRIKRKGWSWKLGGNGFVLPDGSTKKVSSEEEVFLAADLPYLPPCKRK